jgi:L-alanine-DL-glutamate epimerase-like enolase superfamily enzyme
VLPRPTVPGPDGLITLPDAPGLGVKIDWEALESLRIDKGTIA